MSNGDFRGFDEHINDNALQIRVATETITRQPHAYTLV